MKKLITLVLLIVAINCAAQTITNHSVYNVESLVNNCCKCLKLADAKLDIEIHPGYYAKSTTIYSEDNLNHFVILINDDLDITQINILICKEISKICAIHNKQSIDNKAIYAVATQLYNNYNKLAE